ncbi:MAG: hypothetical protein ACOH17_12505 [Cellulomonas sp.]
MKGSRASRASRTVVVASWALAVLVAGTVTSWAVTVIGGEQGPSWDRVLAASQVTAELAAQRAMATSAPPTATPTPAPTTAPTAAPVPVVPGPAPVPVPSAAPSAVPSALPPPAAAEVARTWDVTGGRVGASCRGAVLTLLYATPADGWTMEVKHASSDELEVAFRQSESETAVHATCVSGVPTTRTQTETKTDGH